MGLNGATSRRTQELLDWLLRNGRRERLCGEVAATTGAPREVVEDALQDVCLRLATSNKCRGRSEGEVYNWLLTATLHRTKKLLDRAPRRREVLVDTVDARNRREAARSSAGADVEVLERERERELAELVRTAVERLSERQRRVAALHSRGVAGREIAKQLGTSERRVKHLKAETYALARDTLIDAAGGGCQEFERLIGRFSFGLASRGGRVAAQTHMATCERCATLYRRLELIHEKVAALLPVPATAQPDPGLLERALHKTTQALAQAKQQLSDAGAQAKHHAAAGYSRAVEYTPLAGARPGAAAAAIAGCLALGGGAATYCIEQGVDPFDGFGRNRPADAAEAAQQPPDKKPPAEQPPDPPQVPASAPAATPPEPPPEPGPTPPPPAAQQPAAAPTPAPPPAPPAPPPPPPPEPTPPAVQFGEPATPAQSTPAAPTPSPPPAQPAPAPSGGTDLYGP